MRFSCYRGAAYARVRLRSPRSVEFASPQAKKTRYQYQPTATPKRVSSPSPRLTPEGYLSLWILAGASVTKR